MRQRGRLYLTLAACFVGFGALGGLLGWALHKTPTLAAIALALAILGAVFGLRFPRFVV